MKKIAIFIHIGALQVSVTQPIVDRIMSNLQESGLYDAADVIHCGVVGRDLDLIVLPSKAVIVYKSYDPSVYELPTLNQLRQFSILNPDYNVLYLHSKGATNKRCKGINYQQKWSDVMQYFCIAQHKRCIKLLDEGYKAVGCLLQFNKPSCPMKLQGAHFCGNMWWATSEHISTRPHLPPDTSGYGASAEFWIIPQVDSTIPIASLFNHPYTDYSIPECGGLYGNAIENYEDSQDTVFVYGHPLSPSCVSLVVTAVLVLTILLLLILANLHVIISKK